MEYKEILELAEDQRTANEEEYKARLLLADKRREYEQVKAKVLSDATIDGKNAETRKIQMQTALESSAFLSECDNEIVGAEEKVHKAESERKYFDTVVSLTRAWLYSQGGKP